MSSLISLDEGDLGAGIVDEPDVELLISFAAFVEHLWREAFAGALLLGLIVVNDSWTSSRRHFTHNRKDLIRNALWPKFKIIIRLNSELNSNDTGNSQNVQQFFNGCFAKSK